MTTEIISHGSSLEQFIFKPVTYTTHGDDQILTSKFLTDMTQMNVYNTLSGTVEPLSRPS